MGAPSRDRAPAHRRRSVSSWVFLAGCSPAEPASASPAGAIMPVINLARQCFSSERRNVAYPVVSAQGSTPTITVFILVTWQSSLLTGRFSLNLGTISRHDEWGSAGWHGVDFACDAHALVLVRGNDLRGSARFRPERYKVEHWIRLGLIKIEGYGFPAASDSILGKAGAYHFSAHDCGLADTVLGIGSGYAPWRGVLRKSERCEPRHTHHKDKVSHRRHIQFHGRAGAEKASTGVRKSGRRGIGTGFPVRHLSSGAAVCQSSIWLV